MTLTKSEAVNVTSNSPSQDYTHPDDHNLPNYDMTPGFKPFTVLCLQYKNVNLLVKTFFVLINKVNTISFQLPRLYLQPNKIASVDVHYFKSRILHNNGPL